MDLRVSQGVARTLYFALTTYTYQQLTIYVSHLTKDQQNHLSKIFGDLLKDSEDTRIYIHPDLVFVYKWLDGKGTRIDSKCDPYQAIYEAVVSRIPLIDDDIYQSTKIGEPPKADACIYDTEADI